MPTSPSNAGATSESTLPSNSVFSGEITETVSGIDVSPGSGLRQALGIPGDVIGATAHEERLLGMLVELTLRQALERRYSLLELLVLPFHARELLRDGERLRHEALNTARASDDTLVVFGQFVHAQNRDDVLQLLVALQNALDLGRDPVVALADELRVENSR